MDKHIEAAAKAHAEFLGDVLPPRNDVYVEVRNVIEAWMGDRELYEIDAALTPKRNMAAIHRNKGTLGYLVRVSVEGNEE